MLRSMNPNTIDPATLQHNIAIVANAGPKSHFAVRDNKLVQAKQSDPRVPEIIRQTLASAARFEMTPRRIWVYVDGVNCSIGCAIRKSQLLQRCLSPTMQFAEETRQFTTLVINGIPFKKLDIHCLKVTSPVIQRILGDSDEIPEEIPVSFDWEPKPTKHQITVFIGIMLGHPCPRKMPREDAEAMIRMAEYFENKKLRDWAIHMLLKPFSGKNHTQVAAELTELAKTGEHKALEVYPFAHHFFNNGHVTIGDFNPVVLLSIVDPKKMELLDLRSVRIFTGKELFDTLLPFGLHYTEEGFENLLSQFPHVKNITLSSADKLACEMALKMLKNLNHIEIIDENHLRDHFKTWFLEKCGELGPDVLEITFPEDLDPRFLTMYPSGGKR